MTTKFLKINPDDNVAVAISNLSKGEQLNVEGTEVTLLEDVPAGHKFTLKDIKEGENVIKYGFPIGHAKEELKQGRWAYDKNIKTNLAGTLEYEYKPISVTLTDKDEKLTFNGYRRKNGEVGIRNEIWIVPTVGCVNGIADNIITEFKKTLGGAPLKVDAIEAYKHNYGCSQLGDDHEATKKILRDITLHPNAGGVLVLGLGCENNQPDVFEEFLGDYDKSRIKFLVT
ncbi:MAG: UxaA family hydrolase, partial [Paludibacteraceae bacterium]|nr:UxaA family hydrolase [Paludibacteraceae bacterium]